MRTKRASNLSLLVMASWVALRSTLGCGRAIRLSMVGLISLSLGLGTGCSVRKYAIHQLGQTLAKGGSVFASDDDPELVRAAVPFSLKLVEALLVEAPEDEGLLYAAASGFTQYAYAFVQQDAERLEVEDLDAGLAAKARAKKLYLRGRTYALRGLDVRHPGFSASLQKQPLSAVQTLTKADVPLLYWAAVSWGAAISLSKQDANMIADLPIVEALIDRALELDEAYDHGSIHAFLISFEMTRPVKAEEAETKAREHFQRALELTQGQSAAVYVSLAEAVALPRQDKAEFISLLDKALAVDPNARPEWRLLNLISQRRARWLKSRVDELFLD